MRVMVLYSMDRELDNALLHLGTSSDLPKFQDTVHAASMAVSKLQFVGRLNGPEA